MKQAAFAALIAVSSSLAIFQGITLPKANSEKAQTECCDKSMCCPMGGSEDCCVISCE